MSNMDLVEIHLSYKDMVEDFRKWIPEPLDLGLVVHAPELFAGDHTLDLCSDDEDYRQHSIRELSRVAELTRATSPLFHQDGKALHRYQCRRFHASWAPDARRHACPVRQSL